MSSRRALRLLLIVDHQDDYLSIRDLLTDIEQLHCQLEWVSDYELALEAILRQEHDLCLVDHHLGSENGLDLIAAAQAENVQAPFILLAGQGDAELDTHAIDVGAADYLVKGELDGPVLARSIRYAISRAQSMRSLRDSEMRYRLLFEAGPEAMYVVDQRHLGFLAVNQAMVDIYGYSREELQHMTPLDIRPTSERQRFLESVQQVLDCERSCNLGTWQHRHKDGREIFVEALVHKIDFNGLPAFLAVVRNVTDTLHARQEVQRKESAYRQLLTDSRDAVLVLDRDGSVRYANPAAEQLLGAGFAELQGGHLELPVEPGQLRECTLPLFDDRSVAVEAQCSQSEWDGQQMRLLALRDIGPRIESEKQLRLLRRSLEASYNGTLICDAQADDMPIIYANPAFERITGYGAAEVLGQNCRFLHGTEADQPGLDDIRQGLKVNRETHVVLRNFRKDGTPFWNALYIAPVPDEQGRITHFIGIQNDISEQHRFESELAYNTSHDVLTGLPNRSLLEDRLIQGCRIGLRYQRSLAVLFINLDGFKPINDSMGHSAGDQILVEVARRLSQQVRPGDTVARLGGDEFIVILPDLAHEEDALLVADRIIVSIAKPYKVTGIEMHITASIGIALSDGTTEPATMLIQQADLAMHKAKQQGRNNYQWYTQDLSQRVNERVTLRNELQKAIEAEAFQLYYQPQMDARSGRVVGYEALLRWQHSELGFISPAQFVPVAEDTGQIIPLSEWVLRTACRQARALLAEGWSGISMAVNISPVQFQRAGFVNTVRAVLEETGLPPALLELELTESVLLENAERAISVLHELKALGVQLAIDDFGTGFSSLSYLKRLPIDKIKIDRSFVQDVINDSTDAAISLGIISMAHHLKLKVVAEGVESEPQYAFLKENNCDEFQGFYFARPMPLPQLEEFLRAQLDRSQCRASDPAAASQVPTLLMLDDEENILRALSRMLRRDGYQILLASRVQDAFELLAKHKVQVILCDQHMPQMKGAEFFSQVKTLYPDAVRIVLSGCTDQRTVTEAVNQGGIYKFLSKPWEDEEIRIVIAQAFQEYQARKAG
jgi:diguanylate cyclase (GGDEF)-like protein/PAS domain S-box-containing protein